MTELAIELRDLSKIYRTPFQRRRIPAVKRVSLSVQQGEVFGFLGPNGAGKTTTIRILMGLIAATTGEARIFGHRIPSREARSRLGFLPEAPYFYDYLTVTQLLDLTGRLFRQNRKQRKSRTEQLLALVGLEHARNTRLKKYSKGMLQRAGIAQALMNDPDLVVFDEPMSGLDPIGRKEVRDIIHSLADQGKTVFFSSHILADVEMICDHVAIVVGGEIHDMGPLSQLVDKHARGTDVSVQLLDTTQSSDQEVLAKLPPWGHSARIKGDELSLRLPAGVDLDVVLDHLRQIGCKLLSVVPRHETLEELFIRSATDANPKSESQ